jgi:hypothetical protein
VLAALMLAGGVWLANGWLGRWINPDAWRPQISPRGAQASGADPD